MFLVPASIYAAFKDNGWGARPAGMGGAFTAVADDANAPLYNPAGIMQLKSPEGSFMYSKLYTGLDEVKLGLNYLSYVHPTLYTGAFGVNWANFVAEDLYREDTFTLTYAHSLNDIFTNLENEYLIGINLKYLKNSFTLDERTVNDPVFADGKSADAVAVDLGFMMNFYEESIALAVKNINEPDVGLRTKEVAYREYRLGFAYLLGDFWVCEESLPTADLSYRNEELDYHLGWENWFAHRTFALRFGGNRDEVDFGFGYVQDLGSSGIALEFNYALLWPLEIEDTTGSHRASITMRFAGSPIVEVKEEIKKAPSIPVKKTKTKPSIKQKVKAVIPGSIVKEESHGLRVNLSSQLVFDPGKSTIKSRSLNTLDEIKMLLSEYSKNKIIIEGHTDSVGSIISNQRLSESRAHSVYAYLVKNGIDRERITVLGFGESKPIVSNNSSEGRSRNRRVEIVILKESSK